MEDGKLILIKFLENHLIGTLEADRETDMHHIEFNQDDIQYLENLNLIFDGTKGGLVIGNLHIEGGVNLLRYDSIRKKYRYVGEIEGWEYLTFPLKNQECLDNFSTINDKTLNTNSHQKTEFDIPKNCKIIDTKNIKVCFILLSEYHHFIVNRFATKEHIIEVLELERNNNS